MAAGGSIYVSGTGATDAERRLNVVTFAADKLLVLTTAGEIVETSGRVDGILVRPNGDVAPGRVSLPRR